MRSLKITLTLTALVAVLLLTVSGQSNNHNDKDSTVKKIEQMKKDKSIIHLAIDKNHKKPNTSEA